MMYLMELPEGWQLSEVDFPYGTMLEPVPESITFQSVEKFEELQRKASKLEGSDEALWRMSCAYNSLVSKLKELM